MESEVARIIAIIRHLPGALVKLSTVEDALACALSGARQQDSTKSIYVCGGIDIEEELLLAITHQGKPCGSGKDGPVTCEANAWQAKVADCLLSKHLIERVKFGLNGRQLLLFWRMRVPRLSLGQDLHLFGRGAAASTGRVTGVEYGMKL